jgi:GT2 family glycosyltransferase
VKTSVSIIIPSLNSPLIDKVIETVTLQHGFEMVEEIIIIGKDEPGLTRQTQQKAITRFIDTGKPVSASKARNMAIAISKGEVLVFLDSDCLPEPMWLSEHIKMHQSGLHIVGGGIIPAGDNYWSLVYNLTLFHEFLTTNRATRRKYLPTLNLSIRRNVIDKVGLLDETLARGQDIEWTARMWSAGYQPYFWPAAAVYHRHNRTNFQLVWQDCVKSGYYMRQIRLRHPLVLQAPTILKNRHIVVGLAPLIATWTTSRILANNRALFRRYWYTIPALFLTKIAWCWGAGYDHLSL